LLLQSGRAFDHQRLGDRCQFKVRVVLTKTAQLDLQALLAFSQLCAEITAMKSSRQLLNNRMRSKKYYLEKVTSGTVADLR
jgi:hypothetical protein